jgi:hypothetical protein
VPLKAGEHGVQGGDAFSGRADVEYDLERSELVRSWLECAARCECPSLDDCPLFDDRARLPATS